MKKILLTLIILMSISIYAKEFIHSAGINYSIHQEFITYETGMTASTSLNGIGFNYAFRLFNDADSVIGLWTDFNMNYSNQSKTLINSIQTIDLNYENSNFMTLLGELCVGSSFRFALENIDLLASVGLSISGMTSSYSLVNFSSSDIEVYQATNVLFGALIEPSVSYKLNDKYSIMGGIKAHYYFYCLAQAVNVDYYSYWGLLEVSPYIAFNFHF